MKLVGGRGDVRVTPVGSEITLDAGTTVTEAVRLAADSATQRILLRSSEPGVPVRLAGPVEIGPYVDLQDIHVESEDITITGPQTIGDCGGNHGFAFAGVVTYTQDDAGRWQQEGGTD